MINKKKILNKVSNEKNIRKLTETEKKDLKNTFLLMTQEIDMVCKKYHGAKMHVVNGDYGNIKITTPEDFYTFRAIYDVKENEQLQ